MKFGHTLEQIKEKLESRMNFDYIKPVNNLRFNNGNLILNDNEIKLNNIAHRQISQELGIPFNYYTKMFEQDKALLDDNVNKWLFKKENSSKIMVRTLQQVETKEKTVTAFLSESYKRLNNEFLLNELLPKIEENGLFNFKSGYLSPDNKLYMKFVSEKLTKDVKVGDQVQLGFSVLNAEDGSLSMQFNPTIYRLICTNLAVTPDSEEIFKRNHLTSKKDNIPFDDSGILLSSISSFIDTHIINSKLRSLESSPILDKIINLYHQSMKREIGWNITDETLNKLKDEFKLNLEEIKMVAERIPEEGNTQWGLLNAFTKTSQFIDDYETASRLEIIGGQITNMNDLEWNKLNRKLSLV